MERRARRIILDAGLSEQAGLADLDLDEALRLLHHARQDEALAGGVRDTRGLQALIDGLCALSSRDGLTGLANQRQFRLVLDRELDRVSRTGEPLALLLIDIDHFKRINDRHGHPAGDQVLMAMARMLESGVRPMDTVARIGGEEWAIVLPSSLPAHACGTAERLRAEIEHAPVFLEGGTPVEYTISCGVAAAAPWAATSTTGLIAEADRALYAAKRAGRNRVCVAGESRQAISAEERSALFDLQGSIPV